MARIVYSALVESINGSIQGTTFQRNAYGHSIKGKPRMVKPNSARQITAKQHFSAAVTKWRSLSPTNKGEWETYATNFPIPSRLNPESYLNGFNAFVRWHGINAYYAPGVTLASPDDGTDVIENIVLELQIDSGVLYFTIAATAVTGTWEAIFFLSRSRPISNRPRVNLTKFISYGLFEDTDTYEIQDQYEAVYGFLPVAGEQLVVDVSFVNHATGQVIETPTQTLEVLPP